MPKCIGEEEGKKYYKGTEPSPKGLGLCAGNRPVGEVQKGADGNWWIVSENKLGVRRWIHYKGPPPQAQPKAPQKTQIPQPRVKVQPTRPQLATVQPTQGRKREVYKVVLKPLVVNDRNQPRNIPLTDFNDSEAQLEEVVRGSLALHHVLEYNYNPQTNEVTVIVERDRKQGWTDDYPNFSDELAALYGPLAEDTWYGGNTALEGNFFLDLKLI